VPDDDVRDVFRRIYDTSHWEGGSGQGSRPDVTLVYRQVVQRLLGASDVRTVVDAGCGDWEFARLIDWSDISYTGIDVVPELVERNQAAFGGANVRFECRDFANSGLPPADLLLCKDVLQHWPIDWVQSFLASAPRRYRYALLTNDVSSVHCAADALNSNIEVGEWRTIDLEMAPFNLNADWRVDYDINEGEWVKRLLLLVRPSHRLVAKMRRSSALRRLADTTRAPELS
jgi:SAM-dependent methyltransferase